MFLIVGLGNPEPEYSMTRHNMGFDVNNKIAKKYEIDISRSKFNGLYGSGIINNEKIILLKPQTYMNLSGQCIKPFIDFYKIPLENILVIQDDLDLEVGTYRIKTNSSSGGHNGIKSIIDCLGHNNFARLKIGISNNKKIDNKDYFLGRFNKEDFYAMAKGLEEVPEGGERCALRHSPDLGSAEGWKAGDLPGVPGLLKRDRRLCLRKI